MTIATTHRIGLVGEGIASSLSPALHTAEARALGLTSYRYELLDLRSLRRSPAETSDVVREAIAAGFTGFNITHPCKQAVIAGLDELDPHAAALGAVNTIVVADGRLFGFNTDYSGFRTALSSGLPEAVLDTVVLCGAGGAGSAVAHALAAAGAQRLVITDTDPARARALAAKVHLAHPDADVVGLGVSGTAAQLADADGVVNASPVGMEGYSGTPFDVAALRPEQWVADIVYRPVRTELLSAATALGCRILDGAQMLVAQAADTLALVTGAEPDRQRMRRQLHDMLRARAALAC
ncbi:MAG: shikimate dehydrogenase [Mycobacterium sp.]